MKICLLMSILTTSPFLLLRLTKIYFSQKLVLFARSAIQILMVNLLNFCFKNIEKGWSKLNFNILFFNFPPHNIKSFYVWHRPRGCTLGRGGYVHQAPPLAHPWLHFSFINCSVWLSFTLNKCLKLPFFRICVLPAPRGRLCPLWLLGGGRGLNPVNVNNLRITPETNNHENNYFANTEFADF